MVFKLVEDNFGRNVFITRWIVFEWEILKVLLFLIMKIEFTQTTYEVPYGLN